MKSLVNSVVDYIREDWKESPLRCVLEILAWFMSLFCSITMMLTVPTPPFMLLYPIFITQCLIFAWASKTRGSIGMLANYTILVTIDTIALLKMMVNG
jgi:hypothetical protein